MRSFSLPLALLALAPLSNTAFADDKEASGLIPRSILFGNPERAGTQISHDGKFLSYDWVSAQG